MNAEQTLKEHYQINIGNFSFSSFFQFFNRPLSFKRKKKPHSKAIKRIDNNQLINEAENSDVLYIEISSEKINALLAQRLICAADIRCLDTNSKQCLKNLCLKTCLYSADSSSDLVGDSNLAGSTLQMEKL